MAAPLSVIGKSINDGRTLFFLGAGASIAGVPRRSRVPAGNQLAVNLKNQLGALPSGPPLSPELSQIAMYYEDQVQRVNLLTEIYDQFRKSKTARALPLTHTLIAKIALKTRNNQIILTTNYDHYMERAFALNRIPYISVSHITNPNHAEHMQLSIVDENRTNTVMPSETFDRTQYSDKSIIYKIHGNLPEPSLLDQDMVVLTETDYYNFAAIHMRQVPKSIVARLKHMDVFYLGYSLMDWNFRLFLYTVMSADDKKILSNSTRTANWAISRSFDWFEKIFWKKFDVNTYDEELEKVIPVLASKLGITL